MLIIGEKVNVMSKSLGPAMRERNAGPILEMAKKQVDAGADMLDINIGPATKDGPELMEWLVTTVQQEFNNIRLCLDTTNPSAMEAGLKVHQGRALINSASGEQSRKDTMLPLAAQYDADIICLTLTEGGIPRDADERCAIAADLMGAAMMAGVDLARIYLDPLVIPISVPMAQQQAMETLNAVRMFKQLNDPPLKTVVGLSNISNGVPDSVKQLMDRAYLLMLMDAGLDAAIMDPLDTELVQAVKAGRIIRNEVLYASSYMEP